MTFSLNTWADIFADLRQAGGTVFGRRYSAIFRPRGPLYLRRLHAVLGGGPDVVEPLLRNAVPQQLFVGDPGEGQRLSGSLLLGPHVDWNDYFLHHLPQLHQLGRAGGGVYLQPATLGPTVGVIVAVNVAEDDVLSGPVQDDAQVEVHSRRPEVRVLGSGHAVQAEARMGDVGLQVKGGGLRCPLLVVG